MTASLFKSPGLFCILVDLNNAVVWVVSIHPPIFHSSSPLSKSLRTVPSCSVIINITITQIFHNFLSFLARSKYLSLLSFSLIFCCGSLGWQKKRKHTLKFSFFFFLIITRSSLLAGIR